MKKLFIALSLLMGLYVYSHAQGGVSGSGCPGNGGTGTNQTFSGGSVVFATNNNGGCGQNGAYGQDNSNLFYNQALTTLQPAFLAFKTQQVGTSAGATTGVYSSSTVIPTSGYIVMLSSGNNILMQGVPTISTTTIFPVPGTGGTQFADGTFLVLQTTGAANIILQSSGTLSGSLLGLGAATRTLMRGKTLLLRLDAQLGTWNEISYGNP